MLKFEFISLVLVFCFILYNLILHKKGKDFYFCITSIVFGIYVLMLLNSCIFPIPFQKELLIDLRAENRMEKKEVMLLPFYYIVDRIEIYGAEAVLLLFIKNILLFFPFTIYLQVLYPKVRKFKEMLKVLVCVATSIELVKGIIIFITKVYYKETCIDNIIMYLVGGILGFYIYKIIIYLYNKIKNKKNEVNI